MKRVFLVPGMVVLAAVVSLPVAAADRARLPEAAPVPVPQQAVETPPVIEEVSAERTPPSAPFPVGWEDDVYCAGWIGSDKELVTGRIVAAEYEDQFTALRGTFIRVDDLDVGAYGAPVVR